MKTILVPTDFSKNAEKAFRFALLLAGKLPARIVLLHVYNLGVISPETPFQYIQKASLELEQSALLKLRAFLRKTKRSRKITCECLVREGMTVEMILETARKKKVSFVVMGTRGASGLKEIFMGSNTSAVIGRTNYPVIAVPENAAIGNLKTITFASDYQPSDAEVIKTIIKLAQPFGARLEVLHVSDVENSEKSQRQAMDRFLKRIRRAVSYPHISFVRIIGNDRAGTIRRFIEEGSTDLLVMSAHYRNLADRLFGSSVTKKVVNHIGVPLMALHHKKSHLLFT